MNEKTNIYRSIFRITLAVGVVIAMTWFSLSQPTFKKNTPSPLRVEAKKLENHVKALSIDFYPRNYGNIQNLNKAAKYIEGQFKLSGARVEIQEFEVEGKKYKNIIARYNIGQGRKMIVGAHYDSCEDTPGADDNSSGVAGILELASLLGREKINREIELVAYTLEEPPFFGTEEMGSFVHANSIQNKDKIEGVLVLEMIGYFSNNKNSQSYPMGLLKLMYPDRGNFIAVVGNLSQRAFTKKIKIRMKGATDLPVYSISAPAGIPGIDFSDHRNYWPLGINAVMITDTAFYRNSEYHGPKDTYDRLDYEKMAKVVAGVFEAIR